MFTGGQSVPLREYDFYIPNAIALLMIFYNRNALKRKSLLEIERGDVILCRISMHC